MLAEAGSFVQTWTNPVLKDIVNTSLSLDHLIAEVFASFCEALIMLYPAKKFLAWHDRRKHTKESCNGQGHEGLHSESILAGVVEE